MTKRQLIEEIRRFNEDATPRFLSQFDPESLKQYLQNLKTAQAHLRRQPRRDPIGHQLRMVG